MGQYDLPYTGPQVEALLAKISELESEMPSKTSDLTNDSGFITSEDVPTKTSDLNNDSGFITNAPVAAEAARAQAAEALLATISSLQAEITRATGVEGTLQDLIDGIAAKIPSAATAQNQLADKAFVNSSIATATATFRGTYNSLAELQAVSADENDYGYVRTTDAAGNTIFKRYKYASGSWVFEYDLNNSSFTASQWAAINSAITAELVEKLRALPTNATLAEALAAKQDVIDDLSSIRSKANSAYQKPSGGIPKTDIDADVLTSLGKADSALQATDIVDNVTTDVATEPLSAKQGKILNDNLSQLGQELTVAALRTIPTTHLTGLKLRTGGLTADTSAYELNYFAAKANISYIINFLHTTGIIRFAYSSSVPAAGGSVTNYKTSASSEGSRLFTPTSDCYIIVAVDTGFGAGDPTVTTPNSSGIGHDVYQLQQEIQEITPAIEKVLPKVVFSIDGYRLSNGNDERYPAGGLIPDANAKCSDYIETDSINAISYVLYNNGANVYGICFYNESKTLIDGVLANGTGTILSSSFPSGTKYFRISGAAAGGYTPEATLEPKTDLVQLANEVNRIQDVLTPRDIFWAVCGDSIVHANHTGIPTLPADDIYCPIDDYTNYPGYINAKSGAHPNFAYFFCKKERIQWANYGYGGTILGNYIPKYLGESNLLYPFVGTRITQFKEGIPWNYISILFGWNDNIYGPIYQKDKWLTETYGEDLGYPVLETQIGTEGFADATQKAACDAIGDDYYFDAFIGTINDQGTDTFYGAYNYAIDYLMKHYPAAKIMIMAPFIGGNDRTHSQKFRAAVIAIAEKFGVACFDFNDLEWWYFTTVINSTPFANPDRQDGKWVEVSGILTPATVEGYNRARFCADSIHPTLLGYQWIADPIGYTLLQK